MHLLKTTTIALLVALTTASAAFAATRGSVSLSVAGSGDGQTVTHTATVADVAWAGRDAPQRRDGQVRITLDPGAISHADLDAWRDGHTRIPSLNLTVQTDDDDTAYLKYKLDRCWIKSWSTSGDADVIVVAYKTLETAG